jgi:hypothetical protein
MKCFNVMVFIRAERVMKLDVDSKNMLIVCVYGCFFLILQRNYQGGVPIL